jgi:hypothetical protein
MTLLLLPSFSQAVQTANYTKVMQGRPDMCKHLATIPSGLLNLGKSPLAPASQSQHLKWNIHIIAVGNAEGHGKYLPYWKSSINGIWRERFWRALEAALASETPSPDYTPKIRMHKEREAWWTHEPEVQATLAERPTGQANRFTTRTTSKLSKQPLDTKKGPRTQDLVNLTGQTTDVAGSQSRAVRAARDTLISLHPTPPQLRFDWRDFIYTDGSVLAEGANVFPGIGAAVYVPAHPSKQIEERTMVVDCQYESKL